MKRSHLLGSAALALCLLLPSAASAISIVPTGTSFGSLPQATFGGTGLDNTHVQITQFGNTILGLTATARFGDPTVTNNGAGTFFATNGGDVPNGTPTLAQWNFDYYVSGMMTGYTTELYYDNNPAVGNPVVTFYPGGNFNYQDSQNLGFAAFNGGTFNPNVAGDFTFAILLFDPTHTEVARDAILVKTTGASVPEGGLSVIMLGAAFGAIGIVGRKYGRRSSFAGIA